jgi:hypothetical protein
MSADEVATAFVSHFYQTFSSGGAAQLVGLYVSLSSCHTVISVHGRVTCALDASS